MQSLGALTSSDFLNASPSTRYKVEVYYGGSWQTPEAIIGDTGGSLTRSISTSMGGSGPSISVIAGSWTAEIYNPSALFHPLHPTSSYVDVFRIGRKVRLSTGLCVSGTNYYWNRMCGVIAKVSFDIRASTIKIEGYDNAQALTDYTLRPLVDQNFGSTRTFIIADGSNVIANGTFDTDVSGWTAYNGFIDCYASGYSGKCLRVGTDASSTPENGVQRAKATITGLVVGGTYHFSFWAKKGSCAWRKVAFVVGTAEDESDVYYQKFRTAVGAWTQFSGEFVASAETLYIALEKASGARATGTMFFDELDIHGVQIRSYPMTITEYPSDPPATGCFLLRQQISADPPLTYQDFYINEDFTWDRDTSTLIFNTDWEMPAAGTTFVAYVYEAWAPEEVIFQLLANAGLYADKAAAEADAIYTPTGITIDRVGFEVGTSGLEAIRLIAERCNYQFYFRYDGKPIFCPKPTFKSAGSEDLTLTESDVADITYAKDDSEFYNRVILTGEVQDRQSEDDLGDKAALTADVSDAMSIAIYGEKSLSIKNTLWQDQNDIDDAAADFLADLKDAKGYSQFTLKACPFPVEMGDTIKLDIPLTPGSSGISATIRGLVRDIKINDFHQTILVEVE